MPAGPARPSAPAGPATTAPAGPMAPAGPCAPAGPGGPSGPRGPISETDSGAYAAGGWACGAVLQPPTNSATAENNSARFNVYLRLMVIASTDSSECASATLQ